MNINFLAGILILALTGAFLPIINKIRISGVLKTIIPSVGYLLTGFLILISGSGNRLLSSFFVTDSVTQLIGLFILIASWMTLLVIYWIRRKDKFVNELVAAILISTAGALFLISSSNFVSLVISMELMVMPTYLMVLFPLKGKSVEASVKYFFNSTLATGTMLLGISFLYGFTGSFNFEVLGRELFRDPFVALAVILILAGFGFELTTFPFQFWGPDIYDGSCPGVSALLSGISKSAAFIAFMRVVYEVFPSVSSHLSFIFAILAAFTMTVGNILALAQKRVSRILAYSSVAHAGYTLVAFAALSVPISTTGILYHSAAYIFMQTGAFLCVAVLLYLWGARTMNDYKGLGKREPLLTGLFLIFLFSLAGIPPLAGFTSKVFVFTAAVKTGMVWLALFGLLNSAFSVAYYLWIAKQMYFEEPTIENARNSPSDKKLILIPLAVMAFFVILLGIWVNPIVNASSSFISAVGF